jgi:ectoine hydroxylase-related dioxygenase (phytanoyl-CoA dioxygenase family)
MPTNDTLPDLSAEYRVSPAQVENYRRDGHILLRNICSPDEIAAYGPVITRCARRLNDDSRPMEERNTFDRAFTLAAGLWKEDENVRRFTLARRFAKIAADLMGVPAVRVYHDVAINKQAGGGYTPWHQDQFYWPMDTPYTVTMWMPLVDTTLEMGTLAFASGSHKTGQLADEGVSDDAHVHYARVIRERDYPLATAELDAGDATFHSGWTLHSAPGNASRSEARQVMTVVYYADGAKTYADMGNPSREHDFRTFMPGVTPGELAVSPLNPLVYGEGV